MTLNMDIAELKPIFLLSEELNYELRIRGIVTTRKDASIKRKMLARAIDLERFRNTELVDPEYDFDRETVAINGILESIRQLIDDFDGPVSDSGYKRIKSRLIHVFHRVKRIVVPVDQNKDLVTTFKNESHATCLELDALLHDKIEEAQQSVPTKNEISCQQSPANSSLVEVPIGIPGASKTVPVYKWNLHFSGDDNFSVKSFLDRVKELSEARNIGKQELFSSAIDLFSGSALLWFRSVRSYIKNWDSLVIALKTHFLPSDYEDRIWDEIRSRTQGHKEPVHIYVAVMETLFSRIDRPVAEVTKLKYIRRNLLPHYTSHLALIDINSIVELLNFCHKIDEAQNIKVNYRTPPNTSSVEPELAYVDREQPCSSRSHQVSKRIATVSTKPPVNSTPNKSRSITHSDRTVTCWNCNQPNHVFSNCTKRRNKFCYACGKPDVVKTNCSCSKNE